MDDEPGIIEMREKDKVSYIFQGDAKKAIEEIQARTGKDGASVLKTALSLYRTMLDLRDCPDLTEDDDADL